MFKEGKPKLEQNSETIIGQGVKVEGNFTGEGNVIIKGNVKGSIKTDSEIYIEEKALVEADSFAKNIIVAGESKGNIKAEEKVKFTHSAKVIGNVECRVFAVEEGAIFNGQCSMGEKRVSKE